MTKKSKLIMMHILTHKNVGPQEAKDTFTHHMAN